MRGIKQWLIEFQKRRQERQRVQEIRRQWRALAFQRQLQLLPFHLLLKKQLRELAACQAAGKPKTILYRALLSIRRRVSPLMPSENVLNVLRNANPIRLLSLPLVVRAKRRLVIWLLCQALKLLRWSLGMGKCSNRSWSKSSGPGKASVSSK